ncbi:MAG TPA: hypothetical protein DEA71_20260 [Nitrospira sp.]|nr:hypothetical protein [Nitrospira sp.]
MSTFLQQLFLITPLFLAAPAVGSSLESTTHLWTFDNDPPETLPSEFQMGTLFDGRPAGKWKVIETERAKSSPRVLGQLMGKGAEHAYKTVLINGIKVSDLALHVSFLPINGKADMGGGLIWRATNDRNYYLTRANPLEQNIRIYRVVNGVRQMLKNFDHIIDVRQWHTLHVIAKGCQIQVFFDDKQVFDLCDKTFSTGQVGLWTKSDAVTYFDDLRLQIVQ